MIRRSEDDIERLCEQAYDTGYRDGAAKLRDLSVPCPDCGDWLREQFVSVAKAMAMARAGSSPNP